MLKTHCAPDTQVPLPLQPWLKPEQPPKAQLVPTGRGVDPVHTGAPPLQLTVPETQSLTSQAPPDVQGTQLPPLQTMLLPQGVPFGLALPASQTALPVEQSVTP